MANRQSNPHVDLGTDHAPLADLMAKSLRMFGDSATFTPSGDLALLLLDLANGVVDEVVMHPYWQGGPIDYYQHPADRREIPDTIVTAGLAGLYATQQGSEKSGLLMGNYYRTMSSILWQRIAGNSPLRVRTFDKGSQSEITGIDLYNPLQRKPVA